MDEEHVSREQFVSAAIALVAAAAAGVFGLHRPSDADVAQLYDRRRILGRTPAEQRFPDRDRKNTGTPALALGESSALHH